MRPQNIEEYEPFFGIYKGHAQTRYGKKVWGVFKDYKIEVYDAFEDKSKLIYVGYTPTGRVAAFKFTYFKNGIRRIVKRILRYFEN